MIRLNKVDGMRYWSIEEASIRTGLKGRTLRMYLMMGKIRGYKFKSLTLLRGDEVMNLVQRGRGRGIGEVNE